MKHGSLFSGIGGFDLAAEWMGWGNTFHCEIDEFCQKVLKYYWPNAKSYSDIKTTDFSIWRGKIDIITGGFPCQPFSVAGKRKGTEDDRHLWPQMLRAIKEIQPNWVVGENVYGIVNWSRGMVFKQVQTDLEDAGYEVFPPIILPACSKNAPHKRDRCWIIAHSFSHRYDRNTDTETNNISRKQPKNTIKEGNGRTSKIGGLSSESIIADTGLQRPPFSKEQATGIEQFDKGGNVANSTSGRGIQILHDIQGRKPNANSVNSFNEQTYWTNFPTQSPICSRDDGLSYGLDGITFSKWRNESIKSFGNTVVPELVFEIFKTIALMELLNNEQKDERSVATKMPKEQKDGVQK